MDGRVGYGHAAVGGCYRRRIAHIESAEQLPQAIIETVKRAIRRHKEEVWRKDNPPYVLYGVGTGIGAVVVLGLVVLLFRGIGRTPRLEPIPVSVDPRLSGQARVRTDIRDR